MRISLHLSSSSSSTFSATFQNLKITSWVFRRCAHPAYVNKRILVIFRKIFYLKITSGVYQRCVHLADWLLIAVSMRVSHGNDSIVIGICKEEYCYEKQGGGIYKGKKEMWMLHKSEEPDYSMKLLGFKLLWECGEFNQASPQTWRLKGKEERLSLIERRILLFILVWCWAENLQWCSSLFWCWGEEIRTE